MANMMLAWPNRFDGAALDQGEWVAEMPLDNLLDRVLAIKARCLDTSYAHFRATLPSDYEIRAISLCNHNLSPTATYRITVATMLHLPPTPMTRAGSMYGQSTRVRLRDLVGVGG